MSAQTGTVFGDWVGREAAGFVDRHIGTTPSDQAAMLAVVGHDSVESLVRAAVPDSIHTSSDGGTLPAPVGETEALAELRLLADRNRASRTLLGLGYYDTVTPAVIQRNVLENPSWYTAYTPYQPEISQGRLEALINFQTMVSELTGLTTANASMLDEGTAVVEGMLLARRASKAKSDVFVVDADAFPQTKALLAGRAAAVGIELVELDLTGPDGVELPESFGVFVQYPAATGAVHDLRAVADASHAHGGLVVVAADLLALTLITAPGEFGADVAVGTSQRFGVPMGFGGPHAGYMAVRTGLERQLPGRLVGVSQDVDGRPAYRLSLQTREQHIRREKATSNICTAQVLLAVMASMYAVYHGPWGLRHIASRVHGHAADLADAISASDLELENDTFFDTLQVFAPGRSAEFVAAARRRGYLVHAVDADCVRLSFDETTTRDDVVLIADVLGVELPPGRGGDGPSGLPEALLRTSDYLTHPVFRTHRSETSMMRYLKHLADKDYALDRGMIPLGSCTMKLNAATEMAAVTWPEFASVHPFAPAEDVEGYLDLIGRGQSGRARGAAGHPGVPPRERRRRAHGLPHPAERSRHERRERRPRRDAGRRRGLRRPGQRRPRRPPPAGRGPRRRSRGADDHLPVDPRRVRARHPRHHRRRPRGRRPGLRRRGQLERPAGLREVRRVRRGRLASEPAQDVLHPARRRRPGRRPGGGEGAPRAVPARAPDGSAGRPTHRSG
jgi:glycine dehydrogenase